MKLFILFFLVIQIPVALSCDNKWIKEAESQLTDLAKRQKELAGKASKVQGSKKKNFNDQINRAGKSSIKTLCICSGKKSACQNKQ